MSEPLKLFLYRQPKGEPLVLLKLTLTLTVKWGQ